MTTTLTPSELRSLGPRVPEVVHGRAGPQGLVHLRRQRPPRPQPHGPTFGRFTAGADRTLDGMRPPTVILADIDGMDLDAEQMAEFAPDATRAAEWLAQNS